MGICLHEVANFARLKPGDPFLFGELTHSEIPPASRRTGPHYRFRDDYCAKRDLLNRRTAPPGACLTPVPGRYTSATDPKGPDKAGESYQRGGFFGGMVRTPRCVPPRDRSTICATEAGTGFNACIDLLRDGKTSFYPCLTAVSSPATLRACDASQPCRDDYVCLATKDTPRSKLGACLPPYFLFQFRIDGHPTPPEGPADPI